MAFCPRKAHGPGHIPLCGIFLLQAFYRLDRSLTGLRLEGQLKLILKLEAAFRSYLLLIWRLDRSLRTARANFTLDKSLICLRLKEQLKLILQLEAIFRLPTAK